jgi:hypothetical protein
LSEASTKTQRGSALPKRSDLFGRAVAMAATIVAFLIVLGIAFTIFKANPANAIVSSILNLDKTLVKPFSEMFTPQNEQVRTVVNWGIGAGVYVVCGQLLSRLFPR